jgi:hypothetical protein
VTRRRQQKSNGREVVEEEENIFNCNACDFIIYAKYANSMFS